MITLADVLRRIEAADLPDFIDRPVDSIATRSAFGDTPLHIAALWGELEMATVLLDAGADIDARGEDDYTPLHYAIEQEKPEVAELLIARGANLLARDRLGLDAYALCAMNRNATIQAMLPEKHA